MTDLTPERPSDSGLRTISPGHASPPSLKRGSAARFLADAAGLVFGILSGIITARALGPTDKGLFSSLTLVSSMVLWVCSMGLGDAAIVLVGQRRATVQEALSVTITAALGLSVVGAALLWAASVLAFHDDWSQVRGATAIACVAMPVSVLALDLAFLLGAQERIVAQSAVAATTAVMTSIGLVLFVGLIPLSVAGGVVANAAGAASGLALTAWLLRRSRLSFRPRFNRAYLTAALRYGVSVAVSYVVTLMFLRVDLLFVYALAGPGPAGLYSVALALSALVGLLPIAISSATFPRLAAVEETAANELTAQACRYSVSAALTGALLLLAVVPIGLPVLFGRAFSAAVGPTLLLLASSVLWSTQWTLCRAAAARGRPRLLLWSFLAGLVVMCGLDFVLIPRLGLTGAAVAAVAGPTAGLLLCLAWYRRSPSWPLPLAAFLPGVGDFRAFVAQSLQLVPLPGRMGAGRRTPRRRTVTEVPPR